jgi:hypothetical protein
MRYWSMVAVCFAALAVASPAHAGSWSVPVVLSAPGENSVDVKVAMNARGDAVVVWRHRIDEYSSQVVVSSRAGHGTFTAPAVMDDQQAEEPQVVIDRDGNSVLLWHQGGDTIRASVGHAGGNFGPAVTIGTDTYFGGGHDLCLGVDSAGDTTAFWTQGDDSFVHYATRPAGGSFSEARTIPNTGDEATRPSCVVSANGDAFVAWTDGLRVSAATRPAGATGFTTKVVREFDQDKPLTSIAGLSANASGQAIVTWSEAMNETYSEQRASASWRPAGGSFGAAETVGKSNGGTLPVLRSTGVTDIYGFQNPPDEGVGSLTRGIDGHYGDYQRWFTTGWDDFSLASDADGNLYAAGRRYYDRSEPLGVAYAMVRPAGGRFPEEMPLSGDGYNVWPVAIAAAGSGHALAAWPRGDFDDFHIELAEYGGTPATGATPAADGSTAGGPAGGAPEPRTLPKMTPSARVSAPRHRRHKRCTRKVAHRHKRMCHRR